MNPLPEPPSSVIATQTTICEGESINLSYTGGSGTTFRWFSGSCGGTQEGTGNNLSVSPTTTTTYYGRWENSCGNSICRDVTITVNPGPVEPSSVTATSTTICEGESTNLSYSGGSGTTFRWFSGSCGGTQVGTGNNLSVSPTTTTTYYGRWENSCGNSICRDVTISVTPLPEPPSSVSATDDTIHEGESTTLSYSGGSGTTFRWFSGSCGGTQVGTGNNVSVSPTSTTIYYGRWENSCGNSICMDVAITVPPNNITSSRISNLIFYPNPTSGYLYIKSETTHYSNLILTLIDNTGKVIYQKNVEDLDLRNEVVLNLSNLEKGFYILRITNKDEIRHQRIIKN